MAKNLQDPHGTNKGFTKFLEEAGDNKIVLVQTPVKNILFIVDPVFLEKLLTFVPQKIDRFNEYEMMGINSFGYQTFLDERTNEHT